MSNIPMLREFKCLDCDFVWQTLQSHNYFMKELLFGECEKCGSTNKKLVKYRLLVNLGDIGVRDSINL